VDYENNIKINCLLENKFHLLHATYDTSKYKKTVKTDYNPINIVNLTRLLLKIAGHGKVLKLLIHNETNYGNISYCQA
jgi:hypothetical protein